ncbi:MAG: hypothetical protein MZV64_31440 [Ignavibacteriales bacterium]|nr:hypothetical protein [Ignavibacteriales bacterium]
MLDAGAAGIFTRRLAGPVGVTGADRAEIRDESGRMAPADVAFRSVSSVLFCEFLRVERRRAAPGEADDFRQDGPRRGARTTLNGRRMNSRFGQRWIAGAMEKGACLSIYF